MNRTFLNRLNRHRHLAIVAMFLLGSAVAQGQADDSHEAALASVVPNFHRATSWLLTGGPPATTDMASLKQHGVTTIVDLRRPVEGTAITGQAAESAGLAYVNLPLGRGRPGRDLIHAFAEVVANHPGEQILLHCASGNRAGTVWAMYQVSQGTDVEQAIDEGLQAGMAPSRGDWIREWNQQLHETNRTNR